MFSALATGAMRAMTFLTGTVTEPANFADIFDASIIDTMIDLLKKLTHLFTIFPVNFVLIGTIVGVAFGLIRKARKAATH